MNDVSHAALQAISEYCLAFESQWTPAESTKLAHWLSKQSIPTAIQLTAILELQKIELELDIRNSIGPNHLACLAVERTDQLANELGIHLPSSALRELVIWEFRLRQEFGDHPRVQDFRSFCNELVADIDLHRVIHNVMPMAVWVHRRQTEQTLTTPLDARLQIGRQQNHEAEPLHRSKERLVVAWESEVTISRKSLTLERYSVAETSVSNHGVAGGICVNRDCLVLVGKSLVFREIDLIEFSPFAIRLTRPRA